MTFRAGAALSYLTALVAAAVGVWWFSLASDLDGLRQRGEADLAVASDRLVGQLQLYRELAALLSDHPDLAALFAGSGDSRVAAQLLQRAADKTGSLEILAISRDGAVLASSEPDPGPLDPLAPHVQRAARHGGLGTWHGVEPVTGRRVFSHAAPVFGPGGPVVGAVVVQADIDAIEAEWRGGTMMVAFTDEAGVIFASNRSELLFLAREVAAPDPTGAYRGVTLAPIPEVRTIRIAGFELWRFDAGRYVPRTALHLTRPLPAIGMTGEALLDVAPALSLATWQALAVAAAGLVVGALLLNLSDRRRALADRLALEAEANARLEQRVRERTAALSAANLALRREVDERRAAETALKRAQADLLQAGKLSALGQMSAGISHELNQPLMAISSFAENGAAFLERERPEKAAENFGRISDLARRMGRIIRNLRAFARQEVQQVRPVDLGAVVEAVLELSAGRLRQAGVNLDWQAPDVPVVVLGGEVRLQQVVMNLVSNAIDAMDGQAGKRLEISLEPGDPVHLSVADSGPGIAAPDRIFDPFYSTKAVGQSEGMGLGLSISYGIVHGFGGMIRGENRPAGGGVFTVELQPAERQAAA